MNNRLYNCKNPYQGDAKKVLCVCSAGLLRSPTAAIVLQKAYSYNTRAAGIDIGHALIPVDPVLLTWADEIVCMSHDQRQAIQSFIDHEILDNKKIYVLNVPDRYGYMDVGLQAEILQRYEEETNVNKDGD